MKHKTTFRHNYVYIHRKGKNNSNISTTTTTTAYRSHFTFKQQLLVVLHRLNDRVVLRRHRLQPGRSRLHLTQVDRPQQRSNDRRHLNLQLDTCVEVNIVVAMRR